MQTLDVRGLSCPIPVLKTKKEVDKGAKELHILGSGRAPKENVTRYARSSGFSVELVSDDGDEWVLEIKK
ncbi:MAG: SirA family protein [Firmicutes bacterium]|nr:SirA family protein [Bacillota bacterium]